MGLVFFLCFLIFFCLYLFLFEEERTRTYRWIGREVGQILEELGEEKNHDQSMILYEFLQQK